MDPSKTFSEKPELEPTSQGLLGENEERLRALVESITTFVWQTDPTGRQLKPSSSAQAFTGLSAEQWVSGCGYAAIHPDDVAPLLTQWQAAVQHRSKFVAEYRLRRHDGVYVPLLTRAVPVLQGDGSVREWVGSCTDITTRVQLLLSERAARQEAEAARQRMALLDSITKDLVGELQEPRAALHRLGDLVVPRLADWCVVYELHADGSIETIAVTSRDPQRSQEVLAGLRRQPTPPDMTWGVPYVLRSGKSEIIPEITEEVLAIAAASYPPEQMRALRSVNPISYLAVPLIAQGKSIGCLVLNQAESGRHFTPQDLALAEEIGVRAALTLERARLFHEAREARAQAEAASQAKDVFLAMLGHELRNPLAPIVTALSLMRLRIGDTALAERQVIERQVHHLERLVDDLLDVSRITSGKIELTREPLVLSEILSKAIELASPLLDKQRHHLSVQVPRDGLSMVGDRGRLAQVFTNLITNAAKYTRPGGQITVVAKREQGEAVVAVRDNGEGIDAQLLPRVFDLFTQGERTLDRAQGGLGLGLCIVRSLVALHGGTVSVHSAGRGLGSEFVVRLPASAAVSAGPEASLLSAEPRGGQQRRVLIVEDNQDAAELLGETLDTLGYQTRIAHDGPSGLVAAAVFAPVVALLDLGLPLLDGYELAQKLRQDWPQLRLIAITGYGQRVDRERSRKAGFDHHLVKPVDLEQLAVLLEATVDQLPAP